MVKRCIGIDVGPVYVRAVQIVGVSGGFRIEKAFSTQTRRASDSLPEILRGLFAKFGFDRRAAVAVSMPHDGVFFRILQTDAAGLDSFPQQAARPLRGGSSALENSFPIPPEQIVAHVCSYHPSSDGKYSVLTAAVSRESLNERLNILAGAKIHPRLVDAPIFAAYSTVAINHPEIKTGRAVIVDVDESCLTLAVTSDNDVLIVRNIPIAVASGEDPAGWAQPSLAGDGQRHVDSIRDTLAEIIAREARITWHRVFGTAIEPNTGVFLITTDADPVYLKSLVEQALDCCVTVVDPSAAVEAAPGQKTAPSTCVAEGLALRLIAPDQTKGINFLDVDSDDKRVPINVKRELLSHTFLAAAIVVFLLVGLFVQLRRLEAAYADVKDRIQETFRAACPQEQNIVSPLAQLEQKLESFRKDCRLFDSFYPTGMRPLQILRTITANAPGKPLDVDDLLITADSVRIMGACDSFESVYEWQRLLQQVPGFGQVDVDAQKRPQTGLVQFTMLIPLAMQEHK
jgi:Tfp pilus assembly PilM family ATPase